MNQKLVGKWTLVSSVAVHAALLVWTPEFEVEAKEKPRIDMVEFQVAPAKPEPEPEPEPEPVPETEPEVAPEPEPEVAPEPEPLEPTEPVSVDEVPEPEASPPELTGQTLATDEGEGFEAPAGSGRSRQGPIRAGVSRAVQKPTKKAKRRKKKKAKAKRAAKAVPLAKLSKKPVPPSLGNALKRNYPPDAKRQGKSGEAKVRARIEADGRIRLAKVSFESASGFGSACRKTLLSSKWSAPVNRVGKQVPTWVSYRCKFRID